VTRPSAVVLPHPPLLVPDLTGPGAAAAEALRSACTAALESMIDARPSLVLVVGAGMVTRRHPDHAWGTLAGYGVRIDAPREHSLTCAPSLPLSLTLGRWLLDRSGHCGALLLQEVSSDESPARCAELGEQLTDELADRAAGGVWLVLGDLSTKRTERAPGSFDPRAEAFDTAVEQAVGSGNPRRVLELDPGLAAELGATGRSVLQVLAGGWRARGDAAGGPVRIDYAGAPYGVGYLVARWA
jgi:hypothetical protein